MTQVIKYNGHQFSQLASITMSLQHVYDEADVTVVADKWTMTVKDFVLPQESCVDCNQEMDTVKDRLSVSGMPLRLEGIGFGDFGNGLLGNVVIINDPNESETFWDIKAGPKPRRAEFERIGDQRAYQVTWTIEFCLSPCVLSDDGVSEFNWSTRYAINDRGYTTRTISGYVRIAQRQENREHDPFEPGNLSSASDWTRDYVTNFFDVPVRFHREQTFSNNMDKSKLDFELVDREIESPNAYPEDVITIRAPMRMSTRFPRYEKVVARSSFSVELELRPNAPRVRAWEIFDALLLQRIGRFQESGKHFILQSLDISEDYFTNRYQFSCEIQTVHPLNDQLVLFGFFQSIPTNWFSYRGSLHNQHNNRGLQRMSDRGKDENYDTGASKLVNLCNQEPELLEPEPELEEPEDKALFALCSVPPPPDLSWLNEDTALIEAPVLERTQHTTYGLAALEQTEFDSNSEISEPMLSHDSSDYETCYSTAPPLQTWIWKGVIQRIGYPIPPIGNKITIGGIAATIIGTPYYMTRLVGYMFCLPVYEAAWNIAYAVDESPTEISDSETDVTNLHKPDQEAG